MLKDVERCFGAFQERFRTLINHIFYWKLKDVVRRSELCVIIQNIIVWLQQNWLVEDEYGEGDVDLVGEFFYEADNDDGGDEVSTLGTLEVDDIHASMDDLEIVEENMNNAGEHWKLRDDLASTHEV